MTLPSFSAQGPQLVFAVVALAWNAFQPPLSGDQEPSSGVFEPLTPSNTKVPFSEEPAVRVLLHGECYS